jgi:hypothetical protein
MLREKTFSTIEVIVKKKKKKKKERCVELRRKRKASDTSAIETIFVQLQENKSFFSRSSHCCWIKTN